ncbi:MAG TPA: BlaI/MecI/CopY family transcriptional regulator [Tissierellaceae bacterium]
MAEYRLTEAEENLAEIIWEREPIKSSELVNICMEKFNWKKSTTYTILKRLEGKKIVKNVNSIVESLVKKEDFYAEQSKIFIEENFEGSLPKFLAAFTRRKKLSQQEVKEIERLINDYKGED